LVRIVDSPMAKKAYAQLEALDGRGELARRFPSCLPQASSRDRQLTSGSQSIPTAQIRRNYPMSWQYVHDDPRTWPRFAPLMIAHDVGRSHDRSTAVIGGNSPIAPRRLGI
jgi:hypothetical protein